MEAPDAIINKDKFLSSTEEMVAVSPSLFHKDFLGKCPALDIKDMTDLEKYLQSDLEILNLAHPDLALYLAVTEGH